MRPLCFVAMCGAPGGDSVYAQLAVAAVHQAGMEPVTGQPTCDRLSLPEFALADVTAAAPETWFALGARHALRPNTMVFIGARNAPACLPEGTILYSPADPAGALPEVVAKLEALRTRRPAQLPFHILEQFHEIGRLKTDVFRDRVDYDGDLKARLEAARTSAQPKEALLAIEGELDPATAELSVLVDLLLSYRAVKDWPRMIALVPRMPAELVRTTLVREQFAFALNRNGDWKRAETILKELIATHGPSPETGSLLGRVYKDRWGESQDAAWLDKAIDAYLDGFQADWRDAFPGINAVNLMELRNPPDERRHTLLPLVRYAVERRIASSKADYWDYATVLELGVLASDHVAAHQALSKAVEAAREIWEPESTLRTLRRIVAARRARGEDTAWLDATGSRLQERMSGFAQ